MRIQYFKMERAQSQWENVVDYNLSESGVDPVSGEPIRKLSLRAGFLKHTAFRA